MFLSLVLRLVVGDSGGSEGVALEPRPLLAGEAGGVEAVEPREEAEDRPLARLTPDPFVVRECVTSDSGVDWTHFLLEGGGVRLGGEWEAGLFMALVTRTGRWVEVFKQNERLPELLCKVVLHVVIVPVVLPHVGLLILLDCLGRVNGELFELVVTLEKSEVNLGVSLFLCHSHADVLLNVELRSL